jgi:hypothetical protein
MLGSGCQQRRPRFGARANGCRFRHAFRLRGAGTCRAPLIRDTECLGGVSDGVQGDNEVAVVEQPNFETVLGFEEDTAHAFLVPEDALFTHRHFHSVVSWSRTNVTQQSLLKATSNKDARINKGTGTSTVDFNAVARRIVELTDLALIHEQLRLVWNGRGAAAAA